MYILPDGDKELRQGEILAGVIQYIYDPETGETSGDQHELVVIASQDCDLTRAFEASIEIPSPVNGILLFPVSPADVGRISAKLNSTLWAPTKLNGNERYHVLQASTPETDLDGVGLPDLLIDFRHFFTLSHFQIMYQIKSGEARRRCVLLPPYRDHLQQRAAYYLSRVALDPPHEIK